jgi:hypothetical protein
MRSLPLPILFCCLAAAGCVSRPDRVSVFIETAPLGATCTLIRDGAPIATVSPTPGIAWVPPGAEDIAIECRRNGFRDASAVVHSTSRMPSFGEALGGSVTRYEYESLPVLALTPQ